MRHLQLYENFEENQPILTDENDLFLVVEYKVPYLTGNVYLFLRLIKPSKMLRVDFDNYSLKEFYGIKEAINTDQIDMFQTFRDIIVNFVNKHGVKTVYFQAKQSRIRIYDRLAQIFSEGYTTLRFHTDKIKQGKDWWFFVKNEYATPEYLQEIEDSWNKTIDLQLEYGTAQAS